VKNLTVESFQKLFPDAKVRKYAKNQIICYQGDKPHHVFFVLKGHIKYYDIDENGNEKILHIIGPQNVFPMLYAFGVSSEINGFYASIDPVEVIAIPLEKFHHATETNIQFCNELTRWFLTEIEQLVFRINSFEKTDSRLKILHALKYLAINYGESVEKWERLNFAATQQFLADFTGLTRETVSGTMNELEREEVIRSAKGRLIEIKKSTLSKVN
jgi:CRP-like cAMP-binding protein